MKITVTGKGAFEGADLTIGREYLVEDAAHGTAAQNRLFHALVQEYFNSGLFSYEAKNAEQLKKAVKRYIGAGFEAFAAVEKTGSATRIGMFDTIDETRKEAVWYGGSQVIRGILKSWAKYTMNERRDTITNLIAEMKTAGVNSARFEEMIDDYNS
jgi:hypothetical protein